MKAALGAACISRVSSPCVCGMKLCMHDTLRALQSNNAAAVLWLYALKSGRKQEARTHAQARMSMLNMFVAVPEFPTTFSCWDQNQQLLLLQTDKFNIQYRCYSIYGSGCWIGGTLPEFQSHSRHWPRALMPCASLRSWEGGVVRRCMCRAGLVGRMSRPSVRWAIIESSSGATSVVGARSLTRPSTTRYTSLQAHTSRICTCRLQECTSSS